MKGYSAMDRDAARRVVVCPTCRAKPGFSCRNRDAYVTVTHKRRVDKFFENTYGANSPAVKALNGVEAPDAPHS